MHNETITTQEFTFTAVFERAEGGYVVSFPEIHNLMTHGETLEEAREMALDCIHGYLESLQELGRPLPESDPTTVKGIYEGLKVELKTL